MVATRPAPIDGVVDQGVCAVTASLLDTVTTVPQALAARDRRRPERAARQGEKKPDGAVRPRRIVVIGGDAPALISFRGDLIAAMAGAGHEVIACAPGPNPEVAEAMLARGARYLPLKLDRAGINPLADLSSMLGLRRLFRQLRPDLVLAYTAKAVIYGAGAARLAGVPHIFAMITGLGYAFIDGRELKRRILRQVTTRLYRASLAGCEAILFQNRDDLEDFRRTGIVGADKTLIRVDGSGVDIAHYAFSPVVPEPPTFLLIARLLRDKGIVEYVEAAKRLRAEHPQARFRLLGPLDPNPAGLSAAVLERWRAEGAIEYLGEAAGRAAAPARQHGLRPAVLSRGHAAYRARGDGDRAGDRHHRRAGLPGDRGRGRQRLSRAGTRRGRPGLGHAAVHHPARPRDRDGQAQPRGRRAALRRPPGQCRDARGDGPDLSAGQVPRAQFARGPINRSESKLRLDIG